MEYVRLPIFVHTPTSESLSSASIEFTLKDCKVIPNIPFFRIDVIEPYFEGNKEYSRIIVSGNPYYSTLTMEEVLYEIEIQNEEQDSINLFNLLTEN